MSSLKPDHHDAKHITLTSDPCTPKFLDPLLITITNLPLSSAAFSAQIWISCTFAPLPGSASAPSPTSLFFLLSYKGCTIKCGCEIFTDPGFKICLCCPCAPVNRGADLPKIIAKVATPVLSESSSELVWHLFCSYALGQTNLKSCFTSTAGQILATFIYKYKDDVIACSRDTCELLKWLLTTAPIRTFG